MEFTENQFAGCVLGLATGDALGAQHEGGACVILRKSRK